MEDKLLAEIRQKNIDLLSLDDLKILKDKLINSIKLDDILQGILKLSLNSLYGCLTSKASPIGNDDIGNSITLTGQGAIKDVNEYVKNYIQEVYCHDLTEKEKEELIQFNDTDSCGITLKALHKRGIDICKGGEVTKRGYEIISDISDKVNKRVTEWAKQELNTDHCTLDMKREKICDFGLYRKKKNYILHVIDDEGKVDEKTGKLKTKWHYAGVELAKAIMPKYLKEMGKRIIEPMILEQDKHKTDQKMQEVYEEFKTLPLTKSCRLARIKTFNKYVSQCNMFNVAKGMQEHIRAAYYHNLVLKLEGIQGYREIMQGDDCQIMMVKPNNKYRIDCIAFRNGELPKEFLEIFEPDYKNIFKKPLQACIISLYDIAGWKCKDVTDEYDGNLFDLFE